MKRLSIVIVTYHSEHDIYDCLDSIWLNTDIPEEELEVIIVDNSEDSTAMFEQLSQRYNSRIMLLSNTYNGGYGQGNNIGIRHASAPVVMIMNPDVRMIEPVFKTVVEAFEVKSSLCLYGMKQLIADHVVSRTSFACTRMMNGYVYPILDAVCNRFNLFFPQFMYIQGSCFFLNKEKFKQIGMFDEELFMYGEEDDIAYRLRNTFGNCMKFNPQLHYMHMVLQRPRTLTYEKRMLDSMVLSNQKKGYPCKKTIRNKLRNIRLQLWREQLKALLGKKNEPLYRMLSDFKAHLKSSLAEIP